MPDGLISSKPSKGHGTITHFSRASPRRPGAPALGVQTARLGPNPNRIAASHTASSGLLDLATAISWIQYSSAGASTHCKPTFGAGMIDPWPPCDGQLRRTIPRKPSFPDSEIMPQRDTLCPGSSRLRLPRVLEAGGHGRVLNVPQCSSRHRQRFLGLRETGVWHISQT